MWSYNWEKYLSRETVQFSALQIKILITEQGECFSNVVLSQLSINVFSFPVKEEYGSYEKLGCLTALRSKKLSHWKLMMLWQILLWKAKGFLGTNKIHLRRHSNPSPQKYAHNILNVWDKYEVLTGYFLHMLCSSSCMEREAFTRIPSYKNKVARYLKKMGSYIIAPFHFVIKAEDSMSSILNFYLETSIFINFLHFWFSSVELLL